MKAKKCDRCGEFFVDYEEFEGYIRLTLASKSPSRYQVKQDLCPKCENSLIEWYNSKNHEHCTDKERSCLQQKGESYES